MEREKKIIETLESLEMPAAQKKSDSWAALQQKLESAKSESNVMGLNRYWKWGAVAAVSLGLIAWSFFTAGDNVEIVQLAKAENAHVLPDGSKVWVNASSTLDYNKDNWSSKRVVQLDGEAYFEVEKGSTFQVLTSMGGVKVLGTSFNVFSRSNMFDVECYEGKVWVERDAENVILEKGMCAEARQDRLNGPMDLAKEDPSWKSGKYAFNRASLNRVFSELEANFAYTIDFPQNEAQFSGEFEATNLQDALDVICTSLGMKYEITSNQRVVIR